MGCFCSTKQIIYLCCCHISYNIMHKHPAFFSIAVKFNCVESNQSPFYKWKTSAKWSHLPLRTMTELGFTWCVLSGCVGVCVRVARLCTCAFGGAETLANLPHASQCPVSEEQWPLSSCSLLKPQERKKNVRAARMQMSPGMRQKLLQGDGLLGQTHTGAYTTQYMCLHTHLHAQSWTNALTCS